MLGILQKDIIQKALEIEHNRETNLVEFIEKYKNITYEEKVELLKPYKLEPIVDIEVIKSKKIEELSKICAEKIEFGIDVEINGVQEHFSYKTVDQNNIDDLFQLAIQTGLDQPYHSDSGNCKLYTPEQISQIYIAQKINKTQQTTYFNQLREMIVNEYTKQEDKDKILAIKYGDKLTGIYLDNYNVMMENSKNIVNALVGIMTL